MNVLFDYHIHSKISPDSKSSLSEICKRAVSKSLKEIAITDHYECHREDWGSSYYNLRLYKDEMIKARKEFEGKIKIRSGIELGQPHQCEGAAEHILSSYTYDYVIGSSHKLFNGIDISRLNIKNITLDEFCKEYLSELDKLVNWGNFDCLGHLDLVKRHGNDYYNKKIRLFSYYDMLKDILKKLIYNGKGIEINTSGIRQSPKETMPGLDIIKLYKELGGEILTIGSDAHEIKDIGKDISVAIDLAKEAGFKYLTVFENRKPILKNINNYSEV